MVRIKKLKGSVWDLLGAVHGPWHRDGGQLGRTGRGRELFLLLLELGELEEEAEDGLEVAVVDLFWGDILHRDTLGQEEAKAGLDRDWW